MTRLKLTKLLSSSLIVFSLFALAPIAASAEWRQNQNGWWYTEGNSWAIGWRLINGKWYYFYTNGYMAHDTTIDGYKLGSDGAWISDNGANNNANVQNGGQQPQTQQQSQPQQQTQPQQQQQPR